MYPLISSGLAPIWNFPVKPREFPKLSEAENEVKFIEWKNTHLSHILPTTPIKKSIHYDVKVRPFEYLKGMLYMNSVLEEHSRKLFQPIPLRTDIIPKYITLDTACLVSLFCPEKNKDGENIIIENSNNELNTNVPKKRGRKPKGGKITTQQLNDNNNDNEMPNIILHLKCSLSDLSNPQPNLLNSFEANISNEDIQGYNSNDVQCAEIKGDNSSNDFTIFNNIIKLNSYRIYKKFTL